MSVSSPHAGSAASGGLAAAIAMAISQVVFLALGSAPTEALAFGASLASMAFGFTYASVFFAYRARHGKAVTTPATSPEASRV